MRLSPCLHAQRGCCWLLTACRCMCRHVLMNETCTTTCSCLRRWTSWRAPSQPPSGRSTPTRARCACWQHLHCAQQYSEHNCLGTPVGAHSLPCCPATITTTMSGARRRPRATVQLPVQWRPPPHALQPARRRQRRPRRGCGALLRRWKGSRAPSSSCSPSSGERQRSHFHRTAQVHLQLLCRAYKHTCS